MSRRARSYAEASEHVGELLAELRGRGHGVREVALKTGFDYPTHRCGFVTARLAI